MLIEEAEKRSTIRWPVQRRPHGGTAIFAATRSSSSTLGPILAEARPAAGHLGTDGYIIQTGSNAAGNWIAVLSADERGLLFGIGKFLRLMQFRRGRVTVNSRRLAVIARRNTDCAVINGRRRKLMTPGQLLNGISTFATLPSLANAIELLPPRNRRRARQSTCPASAGKDDDRDVPDC